MINEIITKYYDKHLKLRVIKPSTDKSKINVSI